MNDPITDARAGELGDNPAASTDEVVDGELIPDCIDPTDLEWLDSRAIPAEWARDEVDFRSLSGDPAEWPVGLEWLAKHGGGFRVDYPSITGGPGWSQCRSHNPPEDSHGRKRKYVGNSGGTTGERVIITKTMRKRLDAGTYKTVLIVEGTGQTLAMSWLFRDQDDTVVIGVPGCYGWSDGGICAPEVDRVVSGADSVYIVFDADVTSNPNVWDAGTRLAGVVEMATGTRPRFPRFPIGGSKGVDDWIAAQRGPDGVLDEAGVRGKVRNLLDSKTLSKVLTATRPKSKAVQRVAKATTAKVDVERCAVVLPIPGTDGPPQVLAEFAPRIERSYNSQSRLDPKGGKQALHDVALHTPIGVFRVEEWPNRRIRDIEAMCEAAGYPLAVWVNYDGNAALIAAAMKADAMERGVGITQLSEETGWTETADGLAIWLDANGGITSRGYDRSSGRANLNDPNGQRMDLSDLEGTTDEQQCKALRTVVMSRCLFADPAWYVLAMGNLAWGLSGHRPEGMLYLVGGANQGKTQRQTVLAQCLGRKYGMESIIGKNAKVASDVGLGLHHAMVVPDDFAGEDGAGLTVQRADMIEGLDMCIRRSGGSEGERNGRQVKTERNGKWANSDPDASLVSFAASGEEVPAELRYSSKERMIAVEIGKRGWTVDGVDNYDKWVALGKAGTLRLATGTLIKHYASKIDSVGGTEGWLDALRQCRGSVARTLRERTAVVPADADRPVLVAAGRLAGWRLIVEAAVTLGAVNLDEGNEALEDAVDATVKTMDLYYRHHLQGDTTRLTGKRLLDLLREAVASGRWIIGTFGEVQPGQSLLGVERYGDDEEGRRQTTHVCVLARTVAEATGIERRKILSALREVAQPDSDGAHTRGLSWGDGKGSVKAYWIPKALWDDLSV